MPHQSRGSPNCLERCHASAPVSVATGPSAHTGAAKVQLETTRYTGGQTVIRRPRTSGYSFDLLQPGSVVCQVHSSLPRCLRRPGGWPGRFLPPWHTIRLHAPGNLMRPWDESAATLSPNPSACRFSYLHWRG